jgi:hypothetical protein
MARLRLNPTRALLRRATAQLGDTHDEHDDAPPVLILRDAVVSIERVGQHAVARPGVLGFRRSWRGRHLRVQRPAPANRASAPDTNDRWREANQALQYHW